MLENYVRKYAKASILASVLMLIVAILLLVAPSETLDFTIIVFGIIIILDGILHVINYFQGDSAQKIISFELVEGIIEIFAGTFIIMYSEQLMIFLQVIFSVWIILKSLILFQISFKIREIKQSGWICMLVISIIGIILEKKDEVEKLNSILHEYSNRIIGRMGMPYSKKSINIITIVIY